MGFDKGRIILDSLNNTYYAGQTLSGKLEFQQDKVKTFRGIYVQVKGFAYVHWTSRHSRRVNGKSETVTVNHEGKEEYFRIKHYLIGNQTGECKLNPSKYEFPFHCNIPATCPSSYEGKHGHIRYEVKIVVDRAFKVDQEKKLQFRVIKPLDLNLEPNSKNTKYIAHSAPGSKSYTDVVTHIKKGPIPAHTTRNWQLEIDVPALDVYNLSSCGIINIDYSFRVKVSPSGCHSNSEDSKLIILGDIPLRGIQDNVVNPLQDQMPQQQAINVQGGYPGYGDNPYPVASYPSNPEQMPYPGATPYPTTPGPTISPYPNNSSYHAPGTPYPTGNSPYPSGTSPYPTGAPPYPTETSPYPTGTSPYPTGTSPYPTGTSPYPTGTSPYPTGSSPYPTGTSPYPPGNLPPTMNVPMPMPIQSNEASMPLMQKTDTPYPPVNPNIAPSAPAIYEFK